MIDIDLQEVLNYLYYDTSSPSGFRIKEDLYVGAYRGILRKRSGDSVGSINSKGYWDIRVRGKTFLAHRVIAKILGMDIENSHIDHINGNRADNRPENLRCIPTGVLNNRNRKTPNTNTSGTIGVYLNITTQDSKTYENWIAQWIDLKGAKHGRSFSIRKYGYATALKLAIDYRQEKIAELNKLGAGYTEQHGREAGYTHDY